MTKYGKNFLILNLLITNKKRKANNINDKYFILNTDIKCDIFDI